MPYSFKKVFLLSIIGVKVSAITPSATQAYEHNLRLVSRAASTLVWWIPQARVAVITVSNIERLKFSDAHVAIDVGPTQNAGSVYRFYKAALDRTADLESLDFWIKVLDNAESLRSVANSFL